MFGELRDKDNNLIVTSKRKGGFIGLLVCIQSVRHLFYYMQEGHIEMTYLPCYKFSQDHLELLFNAIRSRNGWSYNPTARQFRTALRQILYHAGKRILGSMAANCLALDETAVLAIGSRSTTQEVQQGEGFNLQSQEEVQEVPLHKCNVAMCKICSAAISYMAGFYAFCLQKVISCTDCQDALLHSTQDPCPQRSLILMKNYYGNDTKKGLSYPSGSVCKLLFHAEECFRLSKLTNKFVVEKCISSCLSSLPNTVFQSLQSHHCFETAYGTENHFTSLIHLILRKFFCSRAKKMVKDNNLKKKFHGGNSIHRARIFSNV